MNNRLYNGILIIMIIFLPIIGVLLADYFSLQPSELCKQIECKESPPILEEGLERVKNITHSINFNNEIEEKIKSLEPNNDSDILYKSGYLSGFAVSRYVCKAEGGVGA